MAPPPGRENSARSRTPSRSSVRTAPSAPALNPKRIDPMSHNNLTRRSFVARSTALLGAAATAQNLDPVLTAADAPETHQAMGTRVGEVTPDSAIVWTRLTAHTARNNDGLKIDKPLGDQKLPGPVEKLEGACPGMAGRVRLRYGTKE